MTIQKIYYESMARNALSGFKYCRTLRKKGRFAHNPFKTTYDRMLTNAAFHLGVGVSGLRLSLSDPQPRTSMFK